MVEHQLSRLMETQYVTSFSNIKLSALEHKYLEKIKGGKKRKEEEDPKRVMVEVNGLSLPIGKNFAMSWKLTPKAQSLRARERTVPWPPIFFFLANGSSILKTQAKPTQGKSPKKKLDG